jgi:hypothetical protein
VPGTSFDVSISGIGITLGIWLDRDKEVCVRLHFNNSSQEPVEEDILGRVAYSRADEDGNRIGVEFLENVQEATQPELAQKLNEL